MNGLARSVKLGITVIELVPDFPSLVAVIVTGPPAVRAVTSPFTSTVATPGLPETQVTLRPVSTLPAASLSVAVNCCVLPMTMVAEVGVTLTVATGTGLTVIELVPLCPSLVAVIVIGPPTPTAVTNPTASTVARAGVPDTQVTLRPVSRLPAASLSVAVNCCVLPTMMVAEAGLTVTVLTGGGGSGLTVIELVPLWPSLVAVIVTGPPAVIAVTRPLVASTVATAPLLDDQLTVRPGSTFPFASFVTAESCAVPPTTMLVLPGVTVTVATGTGVTAIELVPTF